MSVVGESVPCNAHCACVTSSVSLSKDVPLGPRGSGYPVLAEKVFTKVQEPDAYI